jgi:uncharacterized membrane protein YeaQ/YmgE (transglycosylase-associated protein family)
MGRGVSWVDLRAGSRAAERAEFARSVALPGRKGRISFTMLEPAIAVCAVVILWFLAILAHALLEEKGLWQYFVYALIGAAALYWLVRFIRWAWETPLPFFNR